MPGFWDNLILYIMIMASAIAFLLLAAAFDRGPFSSLRLPEPYASRVCRGHAWKRQFPLLSNDDIRKFLRIIEEAFDFTKRDVMRLGPDDRLMDLYRTIYPPNAGFWSFVTSVDCFELESFDMGLEEAFDCHVPDDLFDDDDTTLGQFLAFATGHPQMTNQE